ncbi:leucine-rich repeat-containing protein 74B-like [Pecten maximus]|uniref:leucine-rich repeat-containing protein 74B-like n=1 Tax=Pecten maximus TaxID=6579 RepID=UPI0014589EB5|nr:leucine-rich repeat-containing protein 74B-like [Pecten maximus]
MGDKAHLRKLNFSLPSVYRHVVPRKPRIIPRRKSEEYRVTLPPIVMTETSEDFDDSNDMTDKSEDFDDSNDMTDKSEDSDDSDVSDDVVILEENNQRSRPMRRPADTTGLTVYLAACKKYNITPMSTLRRQLQGEMVSIKDQTIQGNNAKAFALALVANFSITNIDLEGSYLGRDGVTYIADVLNNNANITELNLSGNKLMSHGLQIIVNTLRDNRSLRSLDLSDNDLTSNDASYLKDLLLSRCILQRLNFSKNKFEETGGVLIAQGLAKNTEVKVLDISWNHLRGKGAAAIGQSLMNNTTLEELDVSWNGFDFPGCHGLGRGLNVNKSLRELNVSSNRIGPSGMAKVLEGLKNNNTLVSLKIAGNSLGSEGTLAVLNAALHSTIEEIDFGNQPVSNEFVDLLAKQSAQRDIKVRHGKVLQSKTRSEVCDETKYIPGNPLMVLFEFIRMKKLDLLDVFKTLDANSNHSITWQEFQVGVKKSYIPIRTKDLEDLIKNMDLNRDGEINFSELVVAQKAHNARAEKLLANSLDAFDDSNIGQIHHDIQKWCCDKDVCLKRYKLVE